MTVEVSDPTPDSTAKPEIMTVARLSRSPLRAALLKVLRRPFVIISLAWLVVLVLGTALSSLLAPYDPQDQDLSLAYALPTWHHILGTDELGRDLLTRLMFGGNSILLGSLEATVIALVIGVPAGLVIGYLGGVADSIGSFVTNVLFAVPGFVIVLTVAFVSDNNVAAIMGAFGVIASAGITRLVRASTLVARDLLYVDAAKVSGLSRFRILVRHVFPNVTGPLVVQTFFLFSSAFVILTSLSFLGLGFNPLTASWGQMVLEATQNISLHPWLMVPIGFILIVTVMTLNYLGGSIRDALPQAQRSSMLLSRKAVRNVHDPAATSSNRATEPELSDRIDEPLLSVDRLIVSYPTEHGGEQPIVDGTSFQARRGKTLGLVGESGCGKTMTALALAGLIPPPLSMQAAHLRFDGEDIVGWDEARRSTLRGSSIGLISQEPMVALDPCFSVGSTLVETIRLHQKVSRTEAKKQTLDLLRIVGIARAEAVFKSYPHQLSGGMAQRIGIALALSGKPKLLIADEPTTALDVTIQAEILDLLRSIQDEFGTTIIIVTHDLGVVADLCDDVAVMYAGQIIEFGTATQIMENPSHPYTKGLLAATPDLAERGERLATIGGRVPTPPDWPTWCRFADRCPVAIELCRTGPVALRTIAPGHVSRCVRADEVSHTAAKDIAGVSA